MSASNYLADARILCGVHELDSSWYAATWNQGMMTTDSQNIQTAYHIGLSPSILNTKGSGSTGWSL